MRGSLVEAARARREAVRRIVERIRVGERPLTNVEVRDLPPVEGGLRGVPHAAEDGGSRVVDFESYIVYMIRGWAASYRGHGDSYGVAVEVEYSDVGIALPQAHAEERVRMYRETLEALAAREVLARIDSGFLLWDGSLRPIVARHRPGASETSISRAASELKSRLGMDLEEALGEVSTLWLRGEAPASPILASSRVDIEEVRDEDSRWMVLLEWSEKLLAFKSLLEASWSRGVTPVFITKTSRSTSLFRGGLPDVYYLKRIRRFDPFITGYRVLRGLEEMRGLEKGEITGPLLPLEWGLDSFYRDRLGLVEFYVRLDAGAPILKVEAAFDLDLGVDVEGLVSRVARALQALPRARGYPLSLTIAHRRARVGPGEAERVIEVLGLGLERRERWML